MNPADFPPLHQHDERRKPDSSIASWTTGAKETTVTNEHPATTSSLREQSYADIAGQAHVLETNPTPTEQAKGKLLDKNPPGIAPRNLSRSYADASSHAGFPTLAESTEKENARENDLSDLPSTSEILNQSSATKVPPPPVNASFAKMAAKPPPSPSPEAGSQMEDNITNHKQGTRKESSFEPPPPSTKDMHTFPPLESSTTGLSYRSSNQPTSDLIGSASQSYVEAANQDLDQAPPSVQSHVDHQPELEENDLMAESSRKEVRKWKEMEHSENTNDATSEMNMLPQKHTNVDKVISKMERQQQKQRENATRPDHRLYIEKFTIFNTITSLHSNGYSWLASLAVAILLHLRYSPSTSPHRLPFIYRSLTDMVTLPIYTKPLLQAIVLSLPLLRQSRQKLDQDLTAHQYTKGTVRGLRLQDGFRVLKQHEKDSQLQWWQIKLWLSHRLQWLVSYMALQDSSTHLVTSSTLLALKNVDDQV